jgi:uncharacterized protein involved in exopolysaccharide biosynthesis
MLIRLFIWGLVFAIGGAFFVGKESYDKTGAALAQGAIAGLLLGLVVGGAIHALQGRKRK